MLFSLGFDIPRPLRRAGSANSCLSWSLVAFWPVRFGIEILLIIQRFSEFFDVLARYVHLLELKTMCERGKGSMHVAD